MTQLTLVRHGQANTTATNEKDYDRLSDLGHQQARWLGAHFQHANQSFARVYVGSMRRHQETAQGIGTTRFATAKTDGRLNEMPYFDLAKAFQKITGRTATPQNRADFAAHMGDVFNAWEDGALEDVPETYTEFFDRVQSGIDDVSRGNGSALVVTSGGLIGAVMKQTLGLDNYGWAKHCLAILNTSVHRLDYFDGEPHVAGFNALPHLDLPERHSARTFL